MASDGNTKISKNWRQKLGVFSIVERTFEATVDRVHEHPGPDHRVVVTLDFGHKTYDIHFFEPKLSNSEYLKRALHIHRLENDPCEWNPERDKPAGAGTPAHAPAEVLVEANGEHRLCEQCAKLPRFSKYRRRSPIYYKCTSAFVVNP